MVENSGRLNVKILLHIVLQHRILFGYSGFQNLGLLGYSRSSKNPKVAYFSLSRVSRAVASQFKYIMLFLIV